MSIIGFAIICLLAIGLLFAEWKNNELEKEVIKVISAYNELALKTNNKDYISSMISETELAEIKSLKSNGELAKSVKLIRKCASVDLLKAKEYYDKL